MRVVLLFLIMLLYSCGGGIDKVNVNINRAKGGDICDLVVVDSLSVYVADSVLNIGYGAQIDDTMFSFKPFNDRYIYLYDLKSNIYKSAVKTSDKTSWNYHIFNKDTVFFYNASKARLDILDLESNIIDMVAIKLESPSTMNPHIKNAPMIVKDRFLYITGNVTGENKKDLRENRLVTMEYDIDNKTHSYFMPYPEIYSLANWMGNLYRYVYMTYNPDKNLFVYSFPISHDIYTYNLVTEEIDSLYGGSRHIEKIVPFSKNMNEKINMEIEAEEYFKNRSYGNILYDSYREVYYRIADLEPYSPNPKEQYKRVRSVIVLDKDLNVIGECVLDNNISAINSCMAFIDEKGLWLVVDTKNEDYIRYLCYKLNYR